METNREVDAYMDKIEQSRRDVSDTIRALVAETFPEARETMTYGMPTYLNSSEEVVCAFSSRSGYISVYMDPALVEKYRGELGKNCGKSCIRFKGSKDAPMETLRKMLEEERQKAA